MSVMYADAEREAARLRFLFFWGSAAAAGLSMTLAAGRFAFEAGGSSGGWILLVAGIGFGCGAFLTRWQVGSLRSYFVLPVVGWAGVTAMAFAEDGLYSEALFWLPFIPLIAAWAFRRAGLITFGVIALLTPTVLAIGHLADWIHPGHETSIVGVGLHWGGLSSAIVFALILGRVYEHARLRSEEQTRTGGALLQTLVENLRAGVAITDDRARLISFNEALLQVFGIADVPMNIVGTNTWSLIERGTRSVADVAAFRQRIVDIATAREPVSGDEVRMADGRVYERDFIPIELPQGRAAHLWSYHDVTRRLRDRETAVSRLRTDTVTGLVSRAYLEDLLTSECATSDGFALGFIDLDNFKQVNDSMGHAAGDELLRQVSDRFTRAVRTDDVVARLGGDEFALILRGVDRPDVATVVADKLLASLASPFELNEGSAEVGASVGLAFFPQCGESPAVLLKSADQAMYQAKRAGKGRCVLATVSLV